MYVIFIHYIHKMFFRMTVTFCFFLYNDNNMFTNIYKRNWIRTELLYFSYVWFGHLVFNKICISLQQTVGSTFGTFLDSIILCRLTSRSRRAPNFDTYCANKTFLIFCKVFLNKKKKEKWFMHLKYLPAWKLFYSLP